MTSAPSTFIKGRVPPLDVAVVKLIDALARSLAREDDARERMRDQPSLIERESRRHDQ